MQTWSGRAKFTVSAPLGSRQPGDTGNTSSVAFSSPEEFEQWIEKTKKEDALRTAAEAALKRAEEAEKKVRTLVTEPAYIS